MVLQHKLRVVYPARPLARAPSDQEALMATETMNALETEIKAYEERLPELAKSYPNKFVVFKGENFVGAWDTLDAAATQAVALFGRGPYLIRQVGVPRPTLPASVFFRQHGIA